MTDTVACARCNGSGFIASQGAVDCSFCRGSGRVYVSAIKIGRLEKKLARCRTKRDKLAQKVQELERYSKSAGWLRVKEGMEHLENSKRAMIKEKESLYATIQELKAQLWDKKKP